MRKIYTLLILSFLFVDLSVFAQENGVSIGKGKNPPHAKAILEIFSVEKGLLTPRLTSAQRINMFDSNDESAKGLLVFDTDNNAFFFWDGFKWIEVSESTSGNPLNDKDPNDPNGDGDTSDGKSGELGQVKYNIKTESLWYYDGSLWIELSESTAGDPLNDKDPNDPNGDGDTSDGKSGELGQVKYNIKTESLWYYDGSLWIELSESTAGDPLNDKDPNDPNGDGDTSDGKSGELGQVKYNIKTESLWYYDGSLWIELSESTAGDPLNDKDPNDPNGDGDTSDGKSGELGQVKYNIKTESLWYYDGSLWIELSESTAGDPLNDKDPNDPNGDGDTSDGKSGELGQVKYNIKTESLWYYDGGLWIELSESTAGDPLNDKDPNDPNGDGDTSDGKSGELGQVKYNIKTESLWYYDGGLWIELSESTAGDPLNDKDPNDPNGDGDTSDGKSGELGQVKYNIKTESLWYFDGSLWIELSESTAGDPLNDKDPNDPNGDGDTSDGKSGELGQVKYNIKTESLWYYDGSLWIELSESTAGDPLNDKDPNDPNGDGDTSDGKSGELGQVKYNIKTESLWYFDGSLWIELSESTAGDPLNDKDPNDPNGDGDTSDGKSGELGQVKYNIKTESLWYYDGSLWIELSESTAGDPLNDKDPNDPNGDGDTSDGKSGELGQVKYNIKTESLWYYDGSLWIELSESTAGDPLNDKDPNDPNGDGDTSDGKSGELGQVKYNIKTESLWYYDGSLWIELSESTAGDPLNDKDPNDPNGDGDTSDKRIGKAGDIRYSEITKTLWFYDGLEWKPINTDHQLFSDILAVSSDANAQQIKNLADPVDDKDAATKIYVDGLVSDKVDQVSGKQLSSNDYTDADKAIVSDAEQKSNKNAANGYAGLDANKKIDESQLPKMTVGNVYAVNSETEQLALTAVTGDVAVRSDENKTYMHNGGAAGDMSDWTEMKTPSGEVFSVNGKKGDVVIHVADIPGLQTTINNMADLSNVYTKTETNSLLDEKINTPSGQNNKILATDGTGTLVWADKSVFTDSDDQTLSLNGKKIAISEGNEIDLSALLVDNQDLSDVLSQGNSAGGKHIKNLLSPVDDQDAATKLYVDGLTDIKVDKVSGKQLSTNDYTDSEKAIVADAEQKSNKNVSGGYAGLDSNRKIDESQLPKITVGNVYAVDTEAQQLALSASRGDVAVRSDQNKTYMHNGGLAGDMSDWTEMKTPSGEVFSVNGKKGDVSLNITDIPELQTKLDGKADAGASYTKAQSDALLGNKIDTPTGENDKMLTTDATGNLVWADKTSFTDTDDQTLSLTGTVLEIADGNTVDLASISSDDQKITKSGASISLEDGGTVTLNDDDANNEIQDLSFTGDVLKITNNTSASSIDLSAYKDNTDDQALSKSGASISLEDGGTITLNDDDANNEIQDLSFTGDVLKITNNTSASSIDLSAYKDNTDDQALSKSGASISLEYGGTITLNDDDASNEIQDLSLLGNTLKITNNSSATNIDLTSYKDNTDMQSLIVSGSTLSITNGNSVNLTGVSPDEQTLSLSGSTLSISNGNDVDLSNVSSDDQNLAEVLSQGSDAGSKQIKNLADPVDDKDAATKIYVDGLVSDKVDQVAGKQLSSNDYTDADKAIVSDAEQKSNKNAANGYAGLDANKKIDESQLPKMTVGNVYAVNSETEQLALTAVTGDVAVRSDENKTYMHNGGAAGDMSDWTEMKTPSGEVFSVNGKKGDVVIHVADIPGLQTTINNMADLSNVYTKTETNSLLDEKINTPSGQNNKILATDGTGTLVWADKSVFTDSDDQTLSLNGKKIAISEGNEIDLSALLVDNQDLSDVLSQGNSAGGKHIKNLLSPVDDQDAATKLYVDGLTDIKVDKVSGKQLSTNDYTDSEKAIVADAEQKSNKNVSGGYAGLDSNRKIDESQLPKITVGNVYAVDTEAQQLALSASRGDVAVRSDQNKTYMHNGGLAGDMSDWTEMKTPSGEVFSVNGKKGDVSLNITDIPELQTKLDGKADAGASYTKAQADALLGNKIDTPTGENDKMLTTDATGNLVWADKTSFTDTDDQTLSLTGTVLEIADGNTVDLASISSDDQKITKSGASISLEDGGTVTLNDDDANNEIQDLSFTGDVLKITNNTSASSIDLSAYKDNTDDQALSKSGASISLEDGGTITLNDDDANNEIQDLSFTGDVLKITNNTSASSIDLSAYKDNTDDQALSKSGASISLEYGGTITLNDDDASNEIQDLSLLGNTLKITNNSSATNIDLTSYKDNTDMQSLIVSGSTLSITNGNSVNLTGVSPDEQTLSLSGSTLSISNGNDVDLSNVSSDDQNLAEVLSQGSDAGSKQIKNLADPVDDKDAATKIYVDGLVSDKVDQVAGKQLSSNDYTDADKAIVSDAEQKSNKNAANGYAGLDANKKIDESQLPKMTVGNVYAVNSETEQLALTAVTGDVAVRSDENKTYMHNGGAAGDMSDWTEMKTPSGEVFSVNGKKGDVVIHVADIPGLQTTINNMADLSNVYTKTETNSLLDEKINTPSGQNNKILATDGTGTLVWADKSVFTDSDDQTLSLNGKKIAISEGNEIDLSALLVDNQDLSDVLSQGNSAGGKHIKNLLSPVDDQDAATKLYVDGLTDIKVDKVSGKQLSTNDYTDSEKAIVADAEQKSNKNVSGGYAGLDSNRKIDESQLPKITVGNVYAVDTEAQQLALSASRGDVAVRSDQNKTYMHNGGLAGDMSDWTEMKTPSGEVFSVNGKKGDVSLNITDIPELQTKLDGKADAGASYTKAQADALLGNKIDTPTGENDKMLTTDATGNLVWADKTSFTDTDDQTLSLTGTVLEIADGNTVDLASISSDDQKITKSGASISLEDGGTVTLNDDDANNEIQDLSFTGDVLKITNNISASSIDLSAYKDNTDDQALSKSGASISLEDGGTVTLNDDDANNEIQDLSFTGDVLKITNNTSASSIDLSAYKDNTDDQALSKSGASISLEDGGTVTLNDDDANNEIQDLSFTGDVLKITNNISASSIDLSAYKDNTDDQALSKSGASISLEDGGTITLNDDDASNELQDLTGAVLNGSNVLNLSIENGTGTSVDLSALADNTDDQALSKSGASISLEDGGTVTLNDDDANNEIQDLSFTGDVLKITNNTSASSIDLSAYKDNTDDQALSKSGASISLEDGGSVSLNDDDASNELQDLTGAVLNGSNVLNLSIENGTGTSVDLSALADNTDDQEAFEVKYNNSSSGMVATDVKAAIDELKSGSSDDQALSKSGATISLEDGGSVSLNDDDANNEIQDLSFTGDVLKITNNTSASSIDLSAYKDNTDDQKLNEVLTEGNDAGDMQIKNLKDPVDDQDAVTKSYSDNYTFAQPMTSAEMLAISSPKPGRLVFSTDHSPSGSLMIYYNGSWVSLGSANASPYATSVSQSATVLKQGNPVTGSYVYNDVDGDPEATSTFKWYSADDELGANEAEISGAAAKTYTIQTVDVGKYLRFGVTPIAGSGVGQGRHIKSGTFTGPILANEVPTASNVNFTGTVKLANTLTGSYDYADAENDAESGTTFAWYRANNNSGDNAAVISTAKDYKLIAEDVGKFISFAVVPKASSGTSPGSEVRSTYQGPVADNEAPRALNVKFTGTLAITQTLTGTYDYADTESDAESGTTFAWYRADNNAGLNVAAIAGANANTYIPEAADVGKYIAFAVIPGATTGTSPGMEVRSTYQGTVADNLPPEITEATMDAVSFKYGKTVTAKYLYSDNENDPEGTHSYKWYLADDANGNNKVAINGATATTYILQNSEVGKFISVGITPVATSGSSPGKEVLATWEKILNNAPPAFSTVSMDATAFKETYEVTASYSEYSDEESDPEGTHTYKWYLADDASGNNKAAIGGATAAKYTLLNSQIGKFISVGITPVATSGTSPGKEVMATWKEVLANAAPEFTYVGIPDSLYINLEIKPFYGYGDEENDPAGTHLYKWEIADDASGTSNLKELGTGTTYTVLADQEGKYIRLTMTPKATQGTLTGEAKSTEWKLVLPEPPAFEFDVVVDDTYNDVDLPFKSGGTYNATIDWGDDTAPQAVTSYDDSDLRKTFSKAGTYRVKIKGQIGLWDGSETSELPSIKDNGHVRVSKVHSWGQLNRYYKLFQNAHKLISIPNEPLPKNLYGTDFEKMFYRTYVLSTVPAELFAYNRGITSFKGCFRGSGMAIPAGLFDGCTAAQDFYYCFFDSKITSIPSGLFKDCKAATRFANCFRDCDNLTTTGDRLFANLNKVTDFSACFYQCTKLTTVGEALFENCSAATNFGSVFNNCFELSNIAANIFNNCSAAEMFNSMFVNCKKLTIPAGLFDGLTGAKDFLYAFQGSNITSIPAGLFDKCTEVTGFYGAFFECTYLTSIPAGLFDKCTSVTSFDRTFYNCTSLTGNAPELWNTSKWPNVTEHSYCFRDCIGLSNYSSIPYNWK